LSGPIELPFKSPFISAADRVKYVAPDILRSATAGLSDRSQGTQCLSQQVRFVATEKPFSICIAVHDPTVSEHQRGIRSGIK
jgi:hypothetical protein